ncbi:cupin domain-containing protein [Streptomyces phaeochromogenes]|uniref:cupin domain-containing protein n=1 Tax=Streptomyces phaeochromogenes TaxID=1923 RepID=UPI0036B786C0
MTAHTTIDLDKAADFTARRVVNHVDDDGRSTTVEDATATTLTVTPAFTVVDLWRWDSLPASVEDEDRLSAVELVPPPGAGVVRLACFPPDSVLGGADFDAALSALGGEGTHAADDRVAGLHETDTVDVAIVVSGEIVCVTECGETLLRQGDALVQRGNKHAWSNRTDQPVTVAFTMVSATR